MSARRLVAFPEGSTPSVARRNGPGNREEEGRHRVCPSGPLGEKNTGEKSPQNEAAEITMATAWVKKMQEYEN